MNQTIKTLQPLKVEDMQAQFQLCEQLGSSQQWDALGMVYWLQGYDLNALCCFRKADACRQSLNVITDLGMDGAEIELTLVPVAVETEMV